MDEMNAARRAPWAPDGSELDFWIGNWDARWDGGEGTNRLSRILGDRVVLEEFSGRSARGSLEGRSWSVYDAERRLWRQTWVDDHGGYLDLVGDHMDGNLVFRRRAPEEGEGVEQRMVFSDVTPDAFHWSWQSSRDGWQTHAEEWAIDYRRRRAET